MRCPNCGTRNARETRLCVKCAQLLPAEAGAADSPFLGGSATNPTATSPVNSSSASSNALSNSSIPSSSISSAPVTSAPMTSANIAANNASSTNVAANAAGAPTWNASSLNEAATASTGNLGVAPAVGAPSSAVAIAPDAVYKPSGQMGSSAPLLFVAALAGGPLVGVLYHFVSRWINLLLVSQLVAGLLVGAAIYQAVKIGKCRNPRAAIGAALVGALLCFATFLTLNSQYLRPLFVMQQVMAQSTPFNAQSLAQAEAAMTPPRTLIAYLEANARYGVTLRGSHSGSSSSSGTTIKGAWYWALLATEIGLVMLTAGAVAQGAASARFCERCDLWWTNLALNKVHSNGTQDMLALAQARDWNALRLLTTPKKPTDKQYCTAQMQRCPQCSEATMKIQSQSGNAIKTVFETRLNPQEAQMLSGGR